jgi:uncharacterized damage-inducible protein DinB
LVIGVAIPSYLLYGLELTPKALAAIVSRIDPTRFDQAPSPGRFTLGESVAHVLDWEPIFCSRIQLAVTASGSRIEQFDEENMPIERRYGEWDVHESLARLAEERGKTIAFARSLSSGQAAGTILHPKHGVMSCADIGWMLLMHDVYHLEHATLMLS